MPRFTLTTARRALGGAPEQSPDRTVGNVSVPSPTAMASVAGTLAPASTDEAQQPPRPILISIADARTISGLSRSAIYRQLAAGNIRAVKGGSRTLIILQSLMQHLESLPLATFRGSG
jgi:hypothetical protein